MFLNKSKDFGLTNDETDGTIFAHSIILLTGTSTFFPFKVYYIYKNISFKKSIKK